MRAVVPIPIHPTKLDRSTRIVVYSQSVALWIEYKIYTVLQRMLHRCSLTRKLNKRLARDGNFTPYLLVIDAVLVRVSS